MSVTATSSAKSLVRETERENFQIREHVYFLSRGYRNSLDHRLVPARVKLDPPNMALGLLFVEYWDSAGFTGYFELDPAVDVVFRLVNVQRV